MAPKKENSQRKKTASPSSRQPAFHILQGRNPQLDATKRNHHTGPHSTAKVDHSFAAADNSDLNKDDTTSIKISIKRGMICSMRGPTTDVQL